MGAADALRYVPAASLLALLALAAWWRDAVPQAFAHQDKLHHLLGFAVLVLVLRLSFPGRPAVEAGCAALVAAAGIELGQLFIPAREPSLVDVGASALGALLGLALAAWWRRREPQRSRAGHGDTMKGETR